MGEQMADVQPCEHCRPIIEAMKGDMVKLVGDMLASDRELVRHYAIRHGLLEGAEHHLPTNPRDLAGAVLDLLMDAGSGVSDVDMQRLRIRSALLQTPVRGDAT